MEEKDFIHSFSREDNDPQVTHQLFLEMQKKREEIDNLLDEKEFALAVRYCLREILFTYVQPRLCARLFGYRKRKIKWLLHSDAEDVFFVSSAWEAKNAAKNTYKNEFLELVSKNSTKTAFTIDFLIAKAVFFLFYFCVFLFCSK